MSDSIEISYHFDELSNVIDSAMHGTSLIHTSVRCRRRASGRRRLRHRRRAVMHATRAGRSHCWHNCMARAAPHAHLVCSHRPCVPWRVAPMRDATMTRTSLRQSAMKSKQGRTHGRTHGTRAAGRSSPAPSSVVPVACRWSPGNNTGGLPRHAAHLDGEQLRRRRRDTWLAVCVSCTT
eukprot:COSAG02_NODE_25608_length_653_cov_1.375451_2_plen_179_part_01